MPAAYLGGSWWQSCIVRAGRRRTFGGVLVGRGTLPMALLRLRPEERNVWRASGELPGLRKAAGAQEPERALLGLLALIPRCSNSRLLPSWNFASTEFYELAHRWVASRLCSDHLSDRCPTLSPHLVSSHRRS